MPGMIFIVASQTALKLWNKHDSMILKWKSECAQQVFRFISRAVLVTWAEGIVTWCHISWQRYEISSNEIRPSRASNPAVSEINWWHHWLPKILWAQIPNSYPWCQNGACPSWKLHEIAWNDHPILSTHVYMSMYHYESLWISISFIFHTHTHIYILYYQHFWGILSYLTLLMDSHRPNKVIWRREARLMLRGNELTGLAPRLKLGYYPLVN